MIMNRPEPIGPRCCPKTSPLGLRRGRGVAHVAGSYPQLRAGDYGHALTPLPRRKLRAKRTV
jgi:hypothetical protein